MDWITLGIAFEYVFTPYVLIVIAAAAVFGLFVGAIPGLTATMATALLVPVTFFMDPIPAIGAIVTTSAMAIFAGDLPGALLRIPGTPSSAAYTEEANQMVQNGQVEIVLGVSLVCSAIGGLAGTIVLVFTAPLLAELALSFTSFEYFWLGCLGLSCSAIIASQTPLKGFVSLCIGVFLTTIGIDIMHAYPRFAFGITELQGGIGLIPALIGMFAVPQLMRSALSVDEHKGINTAPVGNLFRNLGATLKPYKINMARGWVIGTVVGALPGAGAGMASWVSMAVSKRFSRTPEKFGTGHVEGIVEATSANNAGLSGAWVPALVFGIPGDSITAIVIGVLYMKGINPGPSVFIQTRDLLYALFIIFFVANIAMVFFGWGAIKSARHILSVPHSILVPLIVVFCILGSFAINNSLLGVTVVLVLGLLAYVMEENGFPIAPAILGLVLGQMIEENFLTSVIKAEGNPLGFFERPVSAALGIITIAIWAVPVIMTLVRNVRSSGTHRS